MHENHEGMKVLVVGLGNPILGDDGIGWRVGELIAEKLKTQNTPAGLDKVDVECIAEGGLRLMEIMIGYDYAIVVDALSSGQNSNGDVTCFPIEALPETTGGHIASPHNTTLQNALKLGREMNLDLPNKVIIIGIEAEKVYDFSDKLSPTVRSSLPVAARMVMDLINELGEKDD